MDKFNAVKLLELQHLNDVLAEAILILPNITDLTDQNIEDIYNKIEDICNKIEDIKNEELSILNWKDKN